MDRRTLLARLGALTCLIGLGQRSRALAGPAGGEVSRLIPKLDELSAALRGRSLSIENWRTGMDSLFARVSLEEVMRTIDFERLAEATGFAREGVATTRITFGSGRPRKLAFFPKLFAVDRGRAIIPHGHANMVSAHLTVSGAFHLRQYDQLDRNEEALIIRPSLEKRILPGDLSSIGEDDDNVHWFTAVEPSHSFDVIVTGLDPAAERAYEIFNLDIEQAELLGDGSLRAPRMAVDDALRKYG